MAEHRVVPAARAAGFTLVEMMVAIGILAFGITALIGVLTVGVATRRSSEQKARSVLLAEQVVHHLREQVFATAPPAAGARPPLPTLEDKSLPGFPGTTVSVEFTADPADPELVLAKIAIRWRDQGEVVAEEFQHLLVREEPFSRRVARLQKKP